MTDVDVTSIDLIVMATGRYKKFLNQFLDSAHLHVEGLREIYVLSDEKPASTDVNVHWLPWQHMQWPMPTLLRYQAIAGYQMKFPRDGVLAYVDVDMRFVGPVDFRGITGTFAVEHPGFQNANSENLPYESRTESAFWLEAVPGAKYFCGGVQGGGSLSFLEAVNELAGMIQVDLDKGIIPIWHDESAWNWWCATHPPQFVFSSDYCTPDFDAGPAARIIAISKDHDYYRGGKRFSLRRLLVLSRAAARKLKSVLLSSP